MSHENIMRLWNAAVDGGFVRPKMKVAAKTASYTITEGDFGTVFTTRGGTTTTIFTLPTVSSVYSGNWVLFLNVANYDMVVAGATGELVVFNDLTADTFGIITANERIGAGLLAICDGTSWIVLPITQEAVTIAVDTSASNTPSHTVSATPSHTVSATPSHTVSRTPSQTPSHTQSPSHTVSATPSHTVSRTPSQTPSHTQSPSST
jgi:hypothetical protein